MAKLCGFAVRGVPRTRTHRSTSADNSSTSSPNLLALAEETRSVARQWIHSAIGKAGSDPALLREHFHIPEESFIEPHAAKLIVSKYNKMLAALDRQPLFSIDFSDSKDYAYAYLGGVNWWAALNGYYIWICPPFGNLWLKSRVAVIVHELAHYVGGSGDDDSIRHFASELPLPHGRGVEGCPRDYDHLKPDEAIRNAATYSTFAIHAFYGFDNRAGSY